MPFNSPANDYMYAEDDINNIGWFVADRNQSLRARSASISLSRLKQDRYMTRPNQQNKRLSELPASTGLLTPETVRTGRKPHTTSQCDEEQRQEEQQ